LVHTQGRGTANYETVSSANAVTDAEAFLHNAGLEFEVRNGSFDIYEVSADGTESRHNIKLDLDGMGGDDTTLNGLANAINTEFEVTPGSGDYRIEAVVVGGRLEIHSRVPGMKFAFGEDSSGVLAALGINTFFSGKDAFSIDINPVVESNPGFVAAARSSAPGDNSNAQVLAGLRYEPLMRGGTSTLESYYEELIGALAAESATLQDQYTNQQILRDQAMNERDAISGVSIDEETINLVTYQRMFQATARYIAIVNDLLNTLISMA
jgi:flagellar hook-associated protein 1 FlgK